MAAPAHAVTDISLWHAMSGELGRQLEKLAADFNASQSDYRIVPSYKGSYAGAPTDGSAVAERDCSLRILRGGGWNYHPQLLRSAYRYATAPAVRLENAGLRVARGL